MQIFITLKSVRFSCVRPRLLSTYVLNVLPTVTVRPTRERERERERERGRDVCQKRYHCSFAATSGLKVATESAVTVKVMPFQSASGE